jgi:organic hydroperoxide reductase OsmC/OhrA
MSEIASEFSILVEQVDGYEFRVRFDKPQFDELTLDEPAPLGKDTAPNAARLLAAAVGNCLAASLLFCLAKAGNKAEGMRANVNVQLVRNDRKRIRIGAIDVVLHPRLAGGQAALDGCLATFEDFCVVTQSVREGLDVRVRVEPDPAA